jgi:FdhD protein
MPVGGDRRSDRPRPVAEVPAAVSRRAVRLRAGRAESVEEAVAEERPLVVYVDGEELATLVVSPTDLEELLVGFLTSEGVIPGPAEIRWMAVDPASGEAWVTSRGGVGAGARDRLLRHPVIASCCGRTRPTAYFQSDLSAMRRLADPADGPILPAERAQALMRTLEESTRASLFGETGGVHSALLATEAGEVLAVRSDVGRHNALDKIYGYTLLHRLTTDRCVIAFSGRISSEVLLKAAKIGSPILLSKSAPTSLALELAEEVGVTAVGFIRGDRLTVYTGVERIRVDEGEA